MTRRIDASTLTGMAAPMAVWALHFVLVYSLTGLACDDGATAAGTQDPLAPRAMLLIATGAALAAIAWLALRARRLHRALHDTAPDDAPSHTATDRQRFAARATLMVSGIAALAVVFTAVPALMLPGCT